MPAIADTVSAPEFLALPAAARARKRGALLRGVLEENEELAKLWVSTDDEGRQQIADQWRGELNKRHPEAFTTDGYVFESSRGLTKPVPVQLPVLDSATEEMLGQLAPVAEVREGKTYIRANPAAEAALNRIEDPVARRSVGTLMRMRWGDQAPGSAEITDDIIQKAGPGRRVGGIHDYPVLIPNAVRMAGILGGSVVGALASAPTGPGMVVGTALGGAAGAAVVAPVAQFLEKEVFGTRKEYSVGAAAADVAIGGIPFAPLRGAAPLLRAGVRGAEGGAVGAGIYSVQTALDADSEFSWKELGKHTGLGFAFGGTLGAAEARFLSGRLGVPADRLKGVPLLKLADEVAVAKRMTREEATEFIKDSIDVGRPALPGSRRLAIEGPGTEIVPPSAVRQIGAAPEPLRLTAADVPSSAKATEGAAAVNEPRAQLSGQAVEGAAPAFAGVPVGVAGPKNPFDTTKTSARLRELETNRPRPTDKLYGKKGGSPELRAENDAKNRAWAGDRAKALKAHREAVEKSNEWLWSKTGAIDPALLAYGGAAAVRAGVGAAVGFAQGDTPEDRLGLSLAYGLAGAAFSPAGMRKLGRAAFTSNPLGRAINPEAVVGRDILREMKLGDAAKNALLYRTSRTLRRMDLGLAGLGADANAAKAGVRQYLKGEMNAAYLPAAVRGPAVEMRVMIDSLSDRLVQSGMVEGELRNTIINNMGSYMRRSFQVFASPNWRPEQAVYDNFVRRAMGDGMTEAQAHNLANRLLDREVAENVIMRGGSTVGKNLSSFMKRKNLDEATRALLGEITDPLQGFGETASRLIHLVENDATQKQIAVIGRRIGVFAEQSNPAAGFTVEMAKESSGAFDNFAGLWTRPEFRKAFERVSTADDVGKIWRALTTANAAAKVTKTLLNPESYAPNAIGAMVGVIGNGHLNPINFVKGLGRGMIAIGDEIPFVRRIGERLAADKRAMEREVEEMIRLGVFGESVVAGDVRRTLKESFVGRSKAATDALLLPFSAVYQGTDNTAKLIGYYGEMARYRRAFPNMSEAALKRYAADVVRATTQTYGEIPRLVKSASVVGLLPSFVNFTWEVFRNSHNIARIASLDVKRGMAEGNAHLVRAGAERMAPFVTLLAAGAGAAEVSRRRAGVSDSQEKALRRQVVPDWDRGSVLVWAGYDGARVTYANQSYVFPPAVAMQGVQSALKGESAEDAIMSFGHSLGEQFLTGSVLIIPVLEATVGATFSKRSIVRPQATNIEGAYDRILHVADKAYKPLVARTVDKFLMALREEKGIHGEVYTVGDRVARLLGLRVNKLEVEQRLASGAARLAGELNEATAAYTATHRLNLQPEEKAARYERSEVGRQRIFANARQFAADAGVLGFGEDRVIKYFRDGGMSSEFLLGVLDGVYVPGRADKAVAPAELWDTIAALPTAQRQAAIRAMDVQEAKAMWSRERELYRGITGRDKLVRNLGVDDGSRARYMRRVLDGLPDEKARRAQIADWLRIGAANPEVLVQLQKPGL